jgi:hypothetical protein
MKQFYTALLLGLAACTSNPSIIDKPSPVATETKANTREGATIIVIGNGAPDLRSPSVHVAQQDAQTAAQKDLTLRLAHFINALQMPDGETIAAKVKRDPTLQTKLNTLLESYRIVDKRYFSDGSMDMVAELSVSALVSVVSGVAEKKEKLPALTLIIDARKVKGLPLQLSPRLQDSKGAALFTPEKAQQISTATSIDAARALAKKAPLITLSAEALSGNSVIIPDSELERCNKAGASSIIFVPPSL